MDLIVPLNRLKFGHEDGEGINARVVGRQDGIAELAANLHARGQIENLVVKDAGAGFYAVSNGNRRLAAFRMIHGEDSDQPVNCTLRDVDEAGAFEDSLTTAVTAKQLHPVDQYEAFARLRDRYGKSNEEIARHYGMSEREVEQALALAHLSPTIRELWRKGELKARAAKAFTLAADHKQQDELLEKVREQTFKQTYSDIDESDVKEGLNIDRNGGPLVEFIGIDAYVAAGGKITRDLFGTDHKISDLKLATRMADEKLGEECKRLKEAGWGFAVAKATVRNTHWSYGDLKVTAEPTPEEARRLTDLKLAFDPADEDPDFPEMLAIEQQAYLEHRELQRTITLRAYTPKLMAKAGCFVGIDRDGLLEIEYGKVKPAQKEQASKVEKEERKEQAKAAGRSGDDKPTPEPKALSNALKQRLEAQLIAATRDAIAAEPMLANSPLFEVLAKTVCAQIIPDRPLSMADAVRTKLPTIRQALNPAVFNQALAKRFEAENYFSSAPKGFVLKAITEALNPDEARKVSGKTKAEIWKFAVANLGQTGWLPKELRTVHYAGPGSEGYKRPAAPAPTPEKPASTADHVKSAKAARAEKSAGVQMKRAAAAKKTAKKAAKKKR